MARDSDEDVEKKVPRRYTRAVRDNIPEEELDDEIDAAGARALLNGGRTWTQNPPNGRMRPTLDR